MTPDNTFVSACLFVCLQMVHAARMNLSQLSSNAFIITRQEKREMGENATKY